VNENAAGLGASFSCSTSFATGAPNSAGVVGAGVAVGVTTGEPNREVMPEPGAGVLTGVPNRLLEGRTGAGALTDVLFAKKFGMPPALAGSGCFLASASGVAGWNEMIGVAGFEPSENGRAPSGASLDAVVSAGVCDSVNT
jgi:hypothetical protein